jgi:hypothetical protein
LQKVREDNERYNYLKQKLENARRRKAEQEASVIEEQNRKRAAEEDERKRAIEEEKRQTLEAKTRQLEEEADEKKAAVLGTNAARMSAARDTISSSFIDGTPKITPTVVPQGGWRQRALEKGVTTAPTPPMPERNRISGGGGGGGGGVGGPRNNTGNNRSWN